MKNIPKAILNQIDADGYEVFEVQIDPIREGYATIRGIAFRNSSQFRIVGFTDDGQPKLTYSPFTIPRK